MQIFVGLDWADTHHDVVVKSASGQVLWSGRVEHRWETLQSLEERLVVLAQGVRSDVAVILETSQALVVDWLLTTGFTVYPLNPKVVQGRRKPSGAKTDRLDAALLAEIGRQEHRTLRALRPAEDEWVELRQLCRIEETLVQERTHLTNQLIAALKTYYPVALTLFGDITSSTALAFLATWPALEQARGASVSEIRRFLRQHRYPGYEAAAERIFAQLHEPQLTALPGRARAQVRLVQALVAQLQTLDRHRVQVQERIQELFMAHADSNLWSSVPGAGPLLAPRLLAAFGTDRERFASAEAVQALAGTCPALYQSGRICRARMRRACDRSFRRTMHLLAFSSLRSCAWAKAYYDAQRARGKSHHHALRALGNIWLRILFRMWKDRAPYDEAKFLAARKAHARAA
jgi:transposase